ncbi:hypothetical protein D3C85_998040 [compost metagenome]
MTTIKSIKPSTAILYALRRYRSGSFMCHILNDKFRETGRQGYADAQKVISTIICDDFTLNSHLRRTCRAYGRLRDSGHGIESKACMQARVLWFRTIAAKLKAQGR